MKVKLITYCVALALTHQAFAQTKPETHSELETIVVLGNRIESDEQTYVGSVDIVDEDQLKTGANIMESLSDVPGINAGSDLGRNIGQQFNIRGFGDDERVIIMQNGVPRSSKLFSNQVSSFRTDPDLLKRVETVKGSSSILYGSGAIGGVIDMKLKDANDFINNGDQFGGMIGGRYETNNMHSYRGAIAMKTNNERFDFLIYGKQSHFGDIKLADGGSASYEKVDNDETVTTAYANLGWNITSDQRINFSVYHFENEVETGWNTLSHLDTSMPVIGALSQVDYNVNYTYSPANNNLIDLDVQTYFSHAKYDRTRKPYYDLDYENEDTRYGVYIKNISMFNTGDVEHTLVTGLDYAHREEDAYYINSGVVSDFGSMPNSYNDWGLYAQNISNYKDLELTLGARYDIFDRKVENKPAGDYDNTAFSPRVALSYEVIQGLHFMGGYSVAFRAPTPHETSSDGPLNIHYWYIPNHDLKAETSKEFEGGFSFVRNGVFSAKDSFTSKFMYFDANIDDMITLVELPELGESPDDSMYATYDNVENAKRKGFEFSSKYMIGQWNFGLTYEHLDLYDKETKEKITPFADKVHINAGYEFKDIGLFLGASVNHWFKPEQNPESFDWGTSTYYYVDEAYTQANLVGAWRLDYTGWSLGFLENSTLYFGINNIFDDQYINAQDTTTTSRVGRETNYYVDLDVRF